jgi:hypothetical protein
MRGIRGHAEIRLAGRTEDIKTAFVRAAGNNEGLLSGKGAGLREILVGDKDDFPARFHRPVAAHAPTIEDGLNVFTKADIAWPLLTTTGDEKGNNEECGRTHVSPPSA